MAKAKQTDQASTDTKADETSPDGTTVSPADVAKTSRARKAKYILLYSTFLLKETKHELIGEPVMTETGRQQ